MKKTILKFLVFGFFWILFTKGLLPMDRYLTETRTDYVAYFFLMTILT